MSSRISFFQNASNLLKQSTNLYSNNYTDCSFAFEFLGMDASASYQVSPEFEKIQQNVGFADVDSIGFLNVPASNFSRVFYIKTNNLDTITESITNNMSYGVIGNPTKQVTDGIIPFETFPRNFSYSYSNIRAGFANPALEFSQNTSLYQDYVRYTAKSITGGYALSDVFQNEQALLRGVTQMDGDFNTDLTRLLRNASDCENVSTAIIPSVKDYNFLLSCKTLVDNLLADATTTNANNTSSYARGKRFLEDLKIQSNDIYNTNISNANLSAENVSFAAFGSNKYWVVFHPGDVMAIRLTYKPKNGNGNIASNSLGNLGGNVINDRSYKIYLNMTA